MSMADFVKGCANRSYELSSRKVFLDERGALRAPVTVLRLDPQGHWRSFLVCGLVQSSLNFSGPVNWFGSSAVPSAIPYCGLRKDDCNSITSTIATPTMIGGVVFLILCVRLRSYMRKKVLETRLRHLLIERKDVIQYGESSAGQSRKMSERIPVKSRKIGEDSPEVDSCSRGNLRDKKNKQLENGNDESIPLGVEVRLGDREAFVKKIAKNQSLKTLTQDSEFSEGVVTLARLRHPYLAEFYGICLERSVVRVLFERPTKGTLKDILDHNTFFGDVELRLTLMGNLIENCLPRQGLHFIHTSELKYHGCLNSRTCMLNDRYTIRIVLAGFEHLTSKLSTARSKPWYKRMFNRQKDVTILDHQQADVQSLGLIGTEIFRTNVPKQGLLGQKSLSNAQADVRYMMALCLSHSAPERPSVTELHKWSVANGFAKNTIVELLLSRLQLHASLLEQEVALRSQDLLVEMQKVEDLLREMLPHAIIQKLRNHETVAAELFESATVLFSDIPVFARLVLECAPMEVVTFLSTIHSRFDVVVSEFDAYKVETINDSYVVVSGIPVRNGAKHAAEVCLLSLRLRLAGIGINLPSWGEVTACPRIGINSGLAAAGVVGTRMPRYCLFGDTMNTASRMESHGAANKIHVSDTTRKLALQSSDDVSHLRFKSRGLVSLKLRWETCHGNVLVGMPQEIADLIKCPD
ncbi:Atrial natriuretic peptide receptor 2 [Hypsibius exemplaris]|uniref:guanylate cyclase n=1 Tax=Hypsibius exemplaris TaxID=2072580 RepID=A0A1W0WNH5_HYPEX|nr:Atrial natriuretic peptide receptor 2 [Hypsibius exemplaris]